MHRRHLPSAAASRQAGDPLWLASQASSFAHSIPTGSSTAAAATLAGGPAVAADATATAATAAIPATAAEAGQVDEPASPSRVLQELFKLRADEASETDEEGSPSLGVGAKRAISTRRRSLEQVGCCQSPLPFQGSMGSLQEAWQSSRVRLTDALTHLPSQINHCSCKSRVTQRLA